MDTIRYPIGIQVFETLRNQRCVYADKTMYIHALVNSASNTYFLSRPRRFGKSLLLSTIEAYFRGRKELFEGLAIYDLETEWQSFPVMRFDFSRAQAKCSDDLTEFIVNRLKEYELQFGITDTASVTAVGDRFGMLIERVCKSCGRQVVILIDEYDKGIQEVLDNEAQLNANQDVLRPFFSQIKAQGEFIRFCLITGVARFRNYTLFSGFNNPNDISMDPRYAGICGITKSELLEYFDNGIDSIAKTYDITYEQALDMLRQKYDGYRFTASNELVFNPFSIINCFEKQSVDNYWIASGTPKVFVDFLSKSHFNILDLEDLWVDKMRMEATYSTEDPVPLLFQTGYLTIADVKRNKYRLRLPNGEVFSALVNDLIPRYMGININRYGSMSATLYDCLDNGDIDGLMTVLQSFVSMIPYHEMDIANLEKTYHLVIYELFLILGVDARSEVAISGGRIDMVVYTLRYVYVFEFKLGGTVDEALNQIDDRGYALSWGADGRKVYKIGAVFSPDTRTIAEWRSR